MATDLQSQPSPLAAEPLPPCHSRRDFDVDKGLFFCAHPQVHVAGDLVTAPVCRDCVRWREAPPERFKAFPSGTGRYEGGSCLHLGEQTGLRACPSCAGNVQIKVFACQHPEHQSTTMEECRFCADYEPRLAANSVRRWSVGVTTAPRRKPTLDRCLESVAAAGWQQVRIFAEPRTPISRLASQHALVWRTAPSGAWPNWYLALAELYQREPLADAFLMFQDDALLCRGLRPYLEQMLWPHERLAYVSLYNPLAEPGSDPRWDAMSAGTLLPGAVALVFPNYAARLLLADSQVLLHRRSGPTNGLKGTDAVVSAWAKRRNLPELIHAPSLVQHIGDTTTVSPAGQDRQRRESGSFVGAEFDARVWIARNLEVAASPSATGCE